MRKFVALFIVVILSVCLLSACGGNSSDTLSDLQARIESLEQQLAEAQALQGIKGDTGATGAQGPRGDAGAQGPKGDTGATGAQEPQGNTGAQGPKGDTGATGEQGMPGQPSGLYTLKQEFDIGETIDVYYNGEIAYSLLFRAFVPTLYSGLYIHCAVRNIAYSLHSTSIAQLLHIWWDNGIVASTSLYQSGFFRAGAVNSFFTPSFDNQAMVSTATFYHLMLVVPGTTIPMAIVRNINNLPNSVS